MRRVAWLALVLVTIMICGCEGKARLQAVEGPLAGSPEMTVSFTWDGTGTGTMAVVMPTGELCRGRYFTGRWQGQTLLFPIEQYASYFGSDFDPWLLQYGRALLTGDNGRVIQAEYFTDLNSHGYGLGCDNRGNVYRFVF